MQAPYFFRLVPDCPPWAFQHAVRSYASASVRPTRTSQLTPLASPSLGLGEARGGYLAGWAYPSWLRVSPCAREVHLQYPTLPHGFFGNGKAMALGSLGGQAAVSWRGGLPLVDDLVLAIRSTGGENEI
eukprot:scaffold92911_cov20-Tisochrysis_lutea.AAC.1